MAGGCGCFKSLLGSKLFAQILLLAINGMVLVGGIVMVYFAASKRISSPTSTFLCTGGSSSVLTDPLVLVISFGSIILFISALGMVGACCRSSKYLTAYYVLLMLCVSGTIYASAFCFLFAGKAAEYVDKYYECIRAITGDRFGSSKEEAQAVIGGNLNLAGGLCIACSVLLIVSLHASTVLSGYVMMTRRIMFWCNLLTFVLSAVGLGVSSYAIEKNPSAIPQGSAFPAVCILFFVIIVMCAFYGCVASYSKRVCVLGVQTFICICGLICIFAIAIAALQHNSAAQIWINEHWQQISDNFIRVDKEYVALLAWQNLSIIGITACLVCVILGFNTWASIVVLIVNIKLRDAPNDGELDPIVVGGKRAHVNERMRSFRDSDDGAGLDAISDDESAHLAPVSSRRNDPRKTARGGNYDDGL